MKSLRFPGAFLLGNDILKNFNSYAFNYGQKFVFIGGKRSLGAVRDVLEECFDGNDASCSFVETGRIATVAEVERVEKLREVKEADVVCAVGGGNSMDIARTCANRGKKALIMIPTTVASDAPCSNVSVFYNENGTSVVGDCIFHKCPDLVVVDSKVIANTPVRHIVSGMGDALATFYEATTCRNNPNGIGITNTAMMLAHLARELVLRDGIAARQSVESHIVTPQLENVIEANCFLSGVGGANTGNSGAHGIGDYLGKLPMGHDFMHGERVYVGLMTQMIMEQYPEKEIIEMMRFGRKVGLPLSLADMHVCDVRETAYAVAEALQGDHFIVNLCCDTSVDIMAGAIIQASTMAESI